MKNLVQILSYVAPYKGRMALNLFFNLLTAVFSLVSFSSIIPFLYILFDQNPKTKDASVGNETLQNFNDWFVGYVETEGTRNALMIFCIAVVVLFLLRNLFRYLALHQMAYLRNAAVRDIRNKIYQKLLRLPMAFYTKERKGQILSKMTNDVSEIEWSILGSVEAIFRDPPMVIVFFYGLMVISWKLTLFVILVLPVSGLAISLLSKSLKRTAKKGQNELGNVLSSVEETVGGIRIVKGFTAEGRLLEKFQKQNERYFTLMVRLFRKQYLTSPAGEIISAMAIALILWFGGNLVLKGELLNGAYFIAYIVIFSQLIVPAKALSEAFVRVQRGIAASERIDEILLQDEVVLQKPNAIPIDGFKDKIEFNNVSFSYGNEPVLSNINLTAHCGESIALVGPSGGGKSTLVDLLPRLYDIQSGSLKIDGVDVHDYDVFALRDIFGIVSQQSILFNDTVYNNLLIGNEKATEAEMIEALKVANAYDFVASLREGIHTNIGEAGNQISGGQKQRLSIARAVLKNPPILIFDEATSALDTESERLVQDALNKLMKGRTSFIIAHRLSTVQHVDRIVVIDKGQIVESGRHEELLQTNGLYAKLVSMQEISA